VRTLVHAWQQSRGAAGICIVCTAEQRSEVWFFALDPVTDREQQSEEERPADDAREREGGAQPDAQDAGIARVADEAVGAVRHELPGRCVAREMTREPTVGPDEASGTRHRAEEAQRLEGGAP